MTNKISKISKSKAVAAMAAILTFSVASVHDAAAAQIQSVRHRRPHTVQAPAVHPNGNSAYASSGRYDWRDWSASYRSGWPCVRKDTEGSTWSAFPAWEVDCK